MKKTEITIKALYDLVWQRPLTKLSAEFEITFHELKSICNQNRIPLPPPGYWTSIRHGKKIKLINLPKDVSQAKVVTLQSGSVPRKLSKWEVLMNKIESDANLPLKVPAKLSHPHHLIMKVSNSLSKEQAHYSYYGLTRFGWDELNINVSPKNLKRALRLMNSIIFLLELRGFKILNRYDSTYATINDIEVEIRLREITKTNPNYDSKSWHIPRFIPTSVFVFFIGHGYPEITIKDGKKTLEEQLAKILAKIEVEAGEKLTAKIKYEERRKIEEEQKRILKEKQEIHDLELQKVKNLMLAVNRWHQSKIIREFLKEAANENQFLKEWLEWAFSKADWLDPLARTGDSILTDGDIENLLSH